MQLNIILKVIQLQKGQYLRGQGWISDAVELSSDCTSLLLRVHLSKYLLRSQQCVPTSSRQGASCSNELKPTHTQDTNRERDSAATDLRDTRRCDLGASAG